jgi:hypothetical protein
MNGVMPKLPTALHFVLETAKEIIMSEFKPIGKGSHFKERDIYIDYYFEEVLFRSDMATGKIFQKFYGKNVEVEVENNTRLFNESLLSGIEISKLEYEHGKPRR